MENNDKETIEEIFSGYELSTEEMITVKGGENPVPIVLPNPPRIKV